MKTVPSWLTLDHVWLPYTQMKTAELPLPVVSANGVRLKLADGRELVARNGAPPHAAAGRVIHHLQYD